MILLRLFLLLPFFNDHGSSAFRNFSKKISNLIFFITPLTIGFFIYLFGGSLTVTPRTYTPGHSPPGKIPPGQILPKIIFLRKTTKKYPGSFFFRMTFKRIYIYSLGIYNWRRFQFFCQLFFIHILEGFL